MLVKEDLKKSISKLDDLTNLLKNLAVKARGEKA